MNDIKSTYRMSSSLVVLTTLGSKLVCTVSWAADAVLTVTAACWGGAVMALMRSSVACLQFEMNKI